MTTIVGNNRWHPVDQIPWRIQMMDQWIDVNQQSSAERRKRRRGGVEEG